LWGLLLKAELTCAYTALQHPDRPREGLCEREKVSNEEKKRKRKSQRERKGREKGIVWGRESWNEVWACVDRK
jgi:hypothetical protein